MKFQEKKKKYKSQDSYYKHSYYTMMTTHKHKTKQKMNFIMYYF